MSPGARLVGNSGLWGGFFGSTMVVVWRLGDFDGRVLQLLGVRLVRR